MQKHEQVLPPAAASRESMQRNKYERFDRVPMGRGGVINKNPCRNCFRLYGALFLKAQEAPTKKR